MKSKATLMLMTTTLLSSFLMAEGVSRQARSDRDRWMKNWLTGSKSKPVPFSFKDNEDSGVEMLKEWPRKASRRQLDAFRSELTIRWADPQTGLEVRCVAVEYSDFPVVVWTIYFKNASAKDSPILSEIQALDITLPRKIKENVDLHYIEGDGTPSAYATRLKPIGAGAEMHFSPDGGRPTSGAFPYYNLEWRDQGAIIAVGWSGQWASSFSRDRAGVLHIRAGQERTHLKLHSGEEVRSPMIVQLFWHGGDWTQNLWRRWMRAHNRPRPGGKNVSPILAGGTGGLGLPNYSIELDNEKDQEYFIAKYADEKLNLNYWWMDIYIASTNFWWKEAWDQRDQGLNYDNLRKLTTEFWRVAAYYMGDYYPLTAFSSVSDDWMAWQFARP